MNKNAKGLLAIFGGIAAVVLGMLAVQNLTFSQTISLQVVADPSIEKIQLYSVKNERTVLLSLSPRTGDATKQITLRVNEESKSLFDRPIVQYYAFIMTKDGQQFQSDAFNFSNRDSKLRLSIGMAGHWEIAKR